MCENKAVLYGKMTQVMGKLSRIKETGTHQQGWKYATSEDVKDAVRAAMAEVGLALLVGLENHEIINLEGKGIMVRGTMSFTLCCSESGATVTRQLIGEAADQSKVSDKAFYKLYTTLEKYFLKITFLISSGEELDSDADVPIVAKVANCQGNEMTLSKLLINLDKVERIRGFYSLSSIMACRPKGAVPPPPDDTEGWRQLFVDARDYAFEQLEQVIESQKGFVADHIDEAEAVQSAMDEIEANEDEEMPF